ncbi:MAG: ABC transporter ATP-binding protein [Proteobacteria bacterium]|jgi:phospholipid/cholesterol/gamma-HCH transport system ATP-binding protein|nr:ABC transporter ATP-binding protein [Pseudomonadota bacterium]
MDLVKVENFYKRYGSKEVHKGLSFAVKKGECLGLIGGSGTGKSVLLRSLIGLEKPDSGSVSYLGQELTHFNEDDFVSIRKKIAYAFQGGALFDSMTVFENLAYPLREHTQLSEKEIQTKVLSLLSQFGLAGNEKLYPGNLSGGMQKRVGLARAIILGPEVILYDEPTAGLDPYNTRKIQEMILHLKNTGVTSILVTHDMPVAFTVCDRIAMLGDGRIRAIGTIAEIEAQGENIIAKFAAGEKF